MTKLFAIILCIVCTLGIIVSSMGTLNQAIFKEDGLQDKTVTWIENSIPKKTN